MSVPDRAGVQSTTLVAFDFSSLVVLEILRRWLARAERGSISDRPESRAPDPHLFLFDELFRGTNAVERIAAAEAVLAELVRPDVVKPLNVVVAATHDGERVEFLRGSYAPYHFTDRIEADRLVFDSRFTPGPATTRNAITLLRLDGAPERVVARALKRAAALDAVRGR